MASREIYMTQFDLDRLWPLIGDLEASGSREDFTGLIGELRRATVVTPDEIPPNVVTMNSKVLLRDADTAEETEVTLVFPADADPAEGRVSVLAPVGTAILGYAEGDIVEWPVPAGVRRFRVEKVLYQPEAAGDRDL